MKNIKLVTKLSIGFILIDVFLLISQCVGYSTAKTIIGIEPERQAAFLSNYGIFTLVALIFMLALTVSISIMLIKSIKRPLQEVNKAAEALVKGKIDIKVEKNSDDELGVLLDDFQKIVNSLCYDASMIKEVAEGNLTIDVQPKSEDDLMSRALRKLIKNNQHAIGNIKDAAYQVTTSSSQVASASEALAQGSTEQASAIEQITASIDDIAERTKQNAAQANTAAQLIAQAIEDVKKGNTEMQDMVVAMQEINKASESISKIIKVIDDIAFQTNILALNAAVEAARAGEAGKGFAVVAEEVRNLAAKSASAAAETAEMIEDSIQKAEVGSKIANETAQALDEITNVVRQSETLITEIADASNYQATAIAQIDQAIEQVSQVVQTNSATSEECAAASEELANQAKRVRELVSIYRLNDASMVDMGVSDSMKVHYENANDRNEQIISLKDGFGKY